MKIFTSFQNIWKNFKKSAITLIGDINNTLGSAFGRESRFLKWAENNHYVFEKLEFSSFLEAGFSYWQVRRSHACMKAILIDDHNERKGVYLMTAPFHPMLIKFVPIEELEFRNPIINRLTEKEVD